jgi:hypothetical protein
MAGLRAKGIFKLERPNREVHDVPIAHMASDEEGGVHVGKPPNNIPILGVPLVQTETGGA